MKIYKPLRLGVLTRPYEFDRKHYLVITTFAYCPMGGERVLLGDAEIWNDAAAELGQDGVLDEGMPKDRGEYLVSGKCLTANGTPRTAAQVKVKVGPLEKSVYVIGDRTWRADGTASDPAPFSEMPIDWPHAFGGEGYKQNPVGMGLRPVIGAVGKEVHPLPNIEDPNRLIRSKGDRPTPAGFGPLGVAWEVRLAKLGTFDSKWMNEQMPGYPLDMKPGAWNAAPEDQQLSGFWEGTERIEIENMNGQLRPLVATLPGLVARTFIVQRTAAGDQFREIGTRLDTIHVFPNRETMLLVYRGMAPVATDDGDDVETLMIAADDRLAPRPIEHFQKVLADRKDPQREGLLALQDRDFLPDWGGTAASTSSVAEMTDLTRSEGYYAKHASKRMRREVEAAREKVRAEGGDPDAAFPVPVYPDEHMVADPHDNPLGEIERGDALAEQEDRAFEGRMAKREDEHRAALRAEGRDYDAEVLKEKRAAAGPPKFDAKKEIERLQDIQTLAHNANVATPELDATLSDPEAIDRLYEIERRTREAYRVGAHLAEFRPMPLSDEARLELRQRVVAAVSAGEDLANSDFTRADLSGLDLSGAQMEGAFFECADLRGAQLRDANLTNAVFAAADLTDADFSGATLDGANFGAADLTRAKFEGGIEFKAAIWERATVHGASLKDAVLHECLLHETDFTGTDFTGAAIRRSLVVKTKFGQNKFVGADLTQSTFVELDFSNSDFTRANLENASFVTCVLDGSKFVKANLKSSRFIERCSAKTSDFRGAVIDKSCLRGGDYSGSDFSGASLAASDLAKTNLTGATFYRAILINAFFTRADLSRANFVAANCSDAFFQNATLDGADFKGANLFRADLFRAAGDDKTSFNDALVKFVRKGGSK